MAPALGQIFPPNPTFVEKDMPDLTGKVTIVTGATSGVGFNTASILYSKNATVYIAARSADKARTAINEIQTSAEGAHSRGRLSFLQLDLSNLASIKESANKFLELEDRLDILIHNAGVMTPPAGSKTITVLLPTIASDKWNTNADIRDRGTILKWEQTASGPSSSTNSFFRLFNAPRPQLPRVACAWCGCRP